MLLPFYHRYYTPEKANGERVVLLHGLFCGSFMMNRIAAHLQKDGYEVISYDYHTRKKNTAGHGDDFAEFLKKEVFEPGYFQTLPNKIHFVTHSMGGLVVRAALRKLSEEQRSQIGKCIMIAPPNKGSDIAKAAVRIVPFAEKIVAPIKDLSSDPDSFANTFPEPPENMDVAVIAGDYDTTVLKKYTHLKNERSHLSLKASHTMILFHKETAEHVCHYIQHGSFKEMQP